MLVSAGFFFPVLSRKQATEGCHRKLYIKGSNKLDRIHYGDVGDSKKTSLSEERRCVCFDLYKDLIPYKVAWSWQKAAVKKRHTSIDKDEDQSDMLIILQHPPVYTLGTGSLEKFLNFDIQNAPYELYRTERGGEVTYHGPGQLVMYPILNLRSHKMDLHWYLRSLEEVVIRALSTTFSIKASRIEGLTGVWVDLIPYKVAWSWQKAAVKKQHTSIDIDEDQSDMLIILQHPPVYTLGTVSLEKFLNFDIQNAHFELYRTE